MSDFSSPYTSGFTVFALVGLEDGRAWNGSAFVDPSGARPSCAIATTDTGEDSYEGDLPSTLPGGTYLVQSYLQLGATPADGDPVIGAAFVPFAGGSSSAPATAGLFEQELSAKLAADSVIAAITGGRVFPVKLPQHVSIASGPAVTYRVVSSANQHHLDGPNGLVEARVEFHAFGRVYGDVRAIKEQIRLIFDGFKGTLIALVAVVETNQHADPDLYDEPDDGSDEGTHQVASDYYFRYRVSIPTN